MIQDLIALGMRLDLDVDEDDDPRHQERDLDIVRQLEESVRRLRRAVFELRVKPRGKGLAAAILELATEAARVLGHEPEVTIHGRPDLLPPPLAEDVLAVLREALSNVARHASASTTTVTLTVVSDAVELVVEDDGRGIGPSIAPGDGISNIGRRAEVRHGTMTFEARDGGGSRLVWTCPVAPRSAPAG